MHCIPDALLGILLYRVSAGVSSYIHGWFCFVLRCYCVAQTKMDLLPPY